VGRDASDVEVIWVKREQEYFCEEDWTTQITLIEFDNSASARRLPSPAGGAQSATAEKKRA